MGRPPAFDRDEALGRAMLVFWERGYGATSIEHLVEATGVQRSGLYRTFGSKKDLYLATVERSKDELYAVFAAAAEGKHGKDALNAMAEANVLPRQLTVVGVETPPPMNARVPSSVPPKMFLP